MKLLDNYTHPVGLLETSDQLVAEAATSTTNKIHKKRTSLASAGFKPVIPAIVQLQSHVLDFTATGIGSVVTVTGTQYRCQQFTLITLVEQKEWEVLVQ